MSTIADRQNRPELLRAARAFRRRYALARRWRGLRLGVGLLIGTVGVIVVLVDEEAGVWVAAAAAAWLGLSRSVLIPQERHQQAAGALAQEVFDVGVFGISWSKTIAGDRPAPEDLRAWGERESEAEVRDWYADTLDARHPVDVLLSQRASLTWARQDHATFALLVRWAVAIGWVLTVALGVALDLSLADYLLFLGLPIIPAALDLLELADANASLATIRGRLQRRADGLFQEACSFGRAPSEDDCRELQNGIFTSRMLGGAPNWFYRLTRKRRERDMGAAVDEQVRGLPDSLRRPVPVSGGSSPRRPPPLADS